MFVLTGCSEDAKTSHLNGNACQPRLWNVLGDWPDQLRDSAFLFPFGCILLTRGVKHTGFDQFNYQSNCVCIGQSSFQGKGEDYATTRLLPHFWHIASWGWWTARDGASATWDKRHLTGRATIKATFDYAVIDCASIIFNIISPIF